MKQALKFTAAIIVVFVAAWLIVEIVLDFMWLCYYAGIPM